MNGPDGRVGPSRHRLRSWLGQPWAQRLTRAVPLALHALAWRSQLHPTLDLAAKARARVRASFRIAYLVLPASLVRPRRRATEESNGATKPRVRIIANPMCGGIRGADPLHDVRETAAWLADHGLPSEVCLTERPGHAAELARAAVVAGMEMVVAAGGDGTVNDIVQALAGHATALGVLPMGTVNVWAREVGIPLRLDQAREVLAHGVRRRVDLGRAGTRYFLLMAGIGFDAEVARRVERGVLKRAGLKLLEYPAAVGLLGVTHQPARIWMRTGGKRRSVSALMIIIGNTRLYAGAFTFAKKAVADDGLLDIVIVANGGLLHRASVLLRALLRRATLGPQVRYQRSDLIRLEANRHVPVQVDGEVIGALPMTFSVAPAALTVVVPASAPGDLFVSPPLTPAHYAG
jgi:diacylglycerol kinase (ATP)